jgi:hypothetical protein
MKIKILLATLLQFIVGLSMAQTLETVTTSGNLSSRGIRLSGQASVAATAAATVKELVLGNFTQATSFNNDPRCFIGYKGTNYPIPATGSEGTLLLQAATNTGMPIDFLTGSSTPALRMRINGNGNIGITVNNALQLYPTSANSYAMGVSLWSANTGAINDKYGHPGFVGRNLGWNPTTNQFRVASDNASVNIGTTTGVFFASDFTGIIGRAPAGGTAWSQVDIGSDLTSIVRLAVTTAGNVGIGTVTPQAMLDVRGNGYIQNNLVIGTTNQNTTPFNVAGTNAKLSVRGIIVAEKLKVTQTGWPDYVFEESYQLHSLDSVAAFIKVNKHLPNVPAAAEIEKNGLDVGDNNAVLLRKIEELTLYLIEQNKRIKDLEIKLKEQQAKNQ